MATGVYRRASKNLRLCLSGGDTRFTQLPDIIFAKVLATEAGACDHRRDNQCDSEAGHEQARSSRMELTHAASSRPLNEADMKQRCTMAAHSNTQEWLIGLQRGEIPGVRLTGREAKSHGLFGMCLRSNKAGRETHFFAGDCKHGAKQADFTSLHVGN